MVWLGYIQNSGVSNRGQRIFCFDSIFKININNGNKLYSVRKSIKKYLLNKMEDI